MRWNPFAKKETLLPIGNIDQEPVYSRTDLRYSSPHIKKKIQAHCENCGAPLNPAKARCEYCNSYYKEEENYVLESL
jgi:uncharacterized OB-fold protein